MTLRERLVASVTDIRDRGQRLAQLNRELLASELKEKGRRFGAAMGLFVGAGVLALYALGFALATIAVALALVLPLWLSLLIVTAALLLIVTIMVLVGRSKVQQAQEPVTRDGAGRGQEDGGSDEGERARDGGRRARQGRAPASARGRPHGSAGPRADAGASEPGRRAA